MEPSNKEPSNWKLEASYWQREGNKTFRYFFAFESLKVRIVETIYKALSTYLQ